MAITEPQPTFKARPWGRVMARVLTRPFPSGSFGQRELVCLVRGPVREKKEARRVPLPPDLFLALHAVPSTVPLDHSTPSLRLHCMDHTTRGSPGLGGPGWG